MKRQIGIMILSGLMASFSSANADSIPIPLTVCNNPIPQAYDGLTTADTLTRIDYNLYRDASCNLLDGTVIGSTGSINLASGSSSFQLCYNDAAGSLPKEICNIPDCQDAICSFRVVQLQTPTKIAFGSGDCVQVGCIADNPATWGIFSLETLTFS